MAKTTEKIVRFALEAGAVYIGLQMAANGAFGSGLQTLAVGVENVFGGMAAAMGLGVAPTHRLTPPGSSGVGTGTTHSNALTQMMANNPNFIQQARTWQNDPRTTNPADWNAFRAFEIAIFAPDPGANPPAEWPNGM